MHPLLAPFPPPTKIQGKWNHIRVACKEFISEDSNDGNEPGTERNAVATAVHARVGYGVLIFRGGVFWVRGRGCVVGEGKWYTVSRALSAAQWPCVGECGVWFHAPCTPTPLNIAAPYYPPNHNPIPSLFPFPSLPLHHKHRKHCWLR